VFLVVSLRLFQSLLDQIHVSLGGPDARRRLFLEGVEDVQPFQGFAVGAVPPN